jgi:hypothetical protein
MQPRSKAIASWLALLLGAAGAHRIYLHGQRDWVGWLHLLPTTLGGVGVLRLLHNGQDDRMAWLLVPLLGLMLSQGMLCAIVYGLTPDERWNARHNPAQPAAPGSWAPVFAAGTALLVGGAVLMGTIAYGGQKFFEWQIEQERAAAAEPGNVQNSSQLRP